MAAPALLRPVASLVSGGDVPAPHAGFALPSPIDQRAFSGQCAPCLVPKETWTQFSTNVEVGSLHQWLTASNAGRRTFNMMLSAGHDDARGRAPETSIGKRLLIDCDPAPAKRARWTAATTFVAT